MSDKWCEDCAEYDEKRHCCPRFNRVIRTALDESQQYLYGYNINHLAMIAKVMEQQGITVDKVVEVLTDAGRVVKMVLDEQAEIVKRTISEWRGEEDGKQT